MTDASAEDVSSARDAASATRLTVDLGAIVRNWRTMSGLAAGAECAAVVKADAYGLGAEAVVPALSKAGCGTFFVATAAEGSRVRALAPDAILYVLDGVFPNAEPAFAADGLRPVLSSIEQAESWMPFAVSTDAPPVALHVDTGMNRLGLNASDLVAFDTEQLAPALVMSHLACADDPHHPKNAAQLRTLETLRARVSGVPASLANSAGILLGEAFRFDLVRPGIALYGGRPSRFAANPVEPVVTFEGRIAQVRSAAPGDTVGYGAMRTIRRSTRLAIVAAGYADGYMRAGGSSDTRTGAMAFVAGRHVPVMGRVSMDLIALDVTELPDGAARAGDWVELIGPNVGVDDAAAAAGTISYEILCGIGRRAERSYRGG